MLYIVNKSPADSLALVNCLQRARVGDAVLLIEHAVLAVCSSQPLLTEAVEAGVVVFALLPDLQARGIEVTRGLDNIQYIDYSGFVELVEQNKVIRSWS